MTKNPNQPREYDAVIGGTNVQTIKSWRCVRTLTGHRNAVSSIAISPDGQILASRNYQYLNNNGTVESIIKLWDMNTGWELLDFMVLPHTSGSLTFSPDGQILASYMDEMNEMDEKTVKLWQLSTGRELHTFKINQNLTSFAFSPDGQTLACTSTSQFKLWEISTGRQLNVLTGNGYYSYVTFNIDGQPLIISIEGQDSTILQVNNRQYMTPIKGVYFGRLVCSPNARILVSGHLNIIKLWDMNTGRGICAFTGHKDSISSFAFSPDGQTLASGSADKTIKLWNVITGQEISTLTGHVEGVTSIAFSPDGKTIISGSTDTTIKIWRCD